MSDPVEPFGMQPTTPNPVPPELNPAAEEVKRQVLENAGQGASGLGGALEGVGDVAGVLFSDTATEAASAAVEVGGEVVGGAMEALGSGFEVLGGCAEGCSLMIAVVLLLATAGSVLAFGLFEMDGIAGRKDREDRREPTRSLPASDLRSARR